MPFPVLSGSSIPSFEEMKHTARVNHREGLANLRTLVCHWIDTGELTENQVAAIRMALVTPTPPDTDFEWDALSMLLYNWHHNGVLTTKQSEQTAEAYHRPRLDGRYRITKAIG